MNTINPETIRTARFQTRLETLAREKSISPDAAEAGVLREARVTQMGEPEDVAALAAFVLGPGNVVPRCDPGPGRRSYQNGLKADPPVTVLPGPTQRSGNAAARMVRQSR